MNEQDYLKYRLDDQIKWYSKKSQSCQSKYKWLKGFICLLALSIAPVVLVGTACKDLIISIIGLLISLMTFILSLNKYHENWILYRTTCELLKHEKFLYLTKSGEYNSSEQPLKVLVERCESIISSENIDWSQLHKQDTKVIVNQSNTGS